MTPPMQWLFLIFASVFIAFPALAFGDDAPHTPQRFDADHLIVTERFQEIPLTFDFPEAQRSRVDAGHRRDFAVVYDLSYEEIRQYLQDGFSDVEDIATMTPGAVRYVESRPLRAVGIQLSDSGGRVTLAHPDIRFNFIVDVEPYRRGQTRVIIQNRISSRHVSGFAPYRAPFRTIDAGTIPFRWQ